MQEGLDLLAFLPFSYSVARDSVASAHPIAFSVARDSVASAWPGLTTRSVVPL